MPSFPPGMSGAYYISNMFVVLEEINVRTKALLLLSVQIYHEEWLNQFNLPKTGRLYPRGKGKWHRASAPGQSPASDYGLLKASFVYSEIVVGASEMYVNIGVGSQVTYSTYLEYGTRKMAPRPLWRVARELSRPKIYALFQSEITPGGSGFVGENLGGSI